MVPESSGSLNVLWAAHGSTSALSSVSAVRRWVLPASARLEIVTVAPTGKSALRRLSQWSGDQRAAALEEAETVAHSSIEALESPGITTEVHVRWGTPGREILRQAEAAASDLLVVGSAAQDGGSKGVLGGTAQDVFASARRSVLIARRASDERGAVAVIHTNQEGLPRESRRFVTCDWLPVRLIALREPVKPLGSMLPSYNEAMRAQISERALEAEPPSRPLEPSREHRPWEPHPCSRHDPGLQRLPSLGYAYRHKLVSGAAHRRHSDVAGSITTSYQVP